MSAETPSSFRRTARTLRLMMLDAADALLGRRKDLVPPRTAIQSIGGSDFEAIGRHLTEVAVGIGGLQPEQRIVDIGCGCGRLAVPLTRYLSRGEYSGFDIDRPAIRWCQKHIERRFPNFHFTHADVRNGHYNASGAIEPERFGFPYASSSVDLVFAASVFTHLTREAVRHYLHETHRVMKPGGQCVASFFLIDTESLAKIQAGRTEPRFRIVDGDTAVQLTDDPEAAIAFSETSVRAMFEEADLDVTAVHTGGWRERAGVTYQDLVVATRKAPA